MPTRTANSFKVAVLNLPRQINYEFIDPATNVRLFQCASRKASPR